MLNAPNPEFSISIDEMRFVIQAILATLTVAFYFLIKKFLSDRLPSTNITADIFKHLHNYFMFLHTSIWVIFIAPSIPSEGNNIYMNLIKPIVPSEIWGVALLLQGNAIIWTLYHFKKEIKNTTIFQSRPKA